MKEFIADLLTKVNNSLKTRKRNYIAEQMRFPFYIQVDSNVQSYYNQQPTSSNQLIFWNPENNIPLSGSYYSINTTNNSITLSPGIYFISADTEIKCNGGSGINKKGASGNIQLTVENLSIVSATAAWAEGLDLFSPRASDIVLIEDWNKTLECHLLKH